MLTEKLPPDYRNVSQSLPGIKGLAIVAIVIYHIWGFTKGYPTVSQLAEEAAATGIKGMIEATLSLICALGEHGVHLFLIASGFGLASSWWFRHGNAQIDTPLKLIPFWKRRLLRILPLYWLAHVVLLLLRVANPQWVPFGGEVWNQGQWGVATALFLSVTTLRNLVLPYYFFLNSAWWYIGLAIQLYLLFPLLVSAGKRWGWSQLLSGSLLLSLLYRGMVVALPLNPMATDVFLRGALFPSRLFEFVLGMTIALALLDPKILKNQKIWDRGLEWSLRFVCDRRFLGVNLLLWAIGLGLDLGSSEGWMLLRVPADCLLGIGQFGCLYQLFSLFPQFTHWLKPLGNYSYGIYLLHNGIFVGSWAALVPILPSYWLRLIGVAIICYILGWLFEWGYNQLQKLSFQGS